MRKLHFTHCKKLQFDTPVVSHSFSLRLVPATDSRQIICDLEKEVTPAEHLADVTDEWGTTMCIGDCYAEHDTFSYSVSGIAWVKDTPYIEGPLHPIYRYPSELTRPGEYIEQMYAQAALDAQTPQERAEAWMHLIYSSMIYEKGVTDIHTTAEEVAAAGKGVCQDYAHLMIALCRQYGIAARYACGFMEGVGETHAWVEVFDGYGWIGFDPTHNRRISYGYLKLAHGRDAIDCPVSRGTYCGGAAEQSQFIVTLKEI